MSEILNQIPAQSPGNRSWVGEPAPLSGPDTTTAFFHALFDGYDGDDELRLEIRPAYPLWREAELYPNGDAPANWQFRTGRARRWFALDALGDATRHAHALAQRANVYFGVLPRRGASGRGADVPTARCLWCDIDGGNGGVEGAAALLDSATQSGKIPAPNFQIVSGNGLHVYWLLSDAVVLDTDEAKQKFKNLLKRLCRAIGGTSPDAHADTARCDLASVLRVPGTLNHKRAGNSKPVQIVATSAADAQSPLWWRANLPPLPIPLTPRPERPPLRPGETRDLPPKILDLLTARHPDGTKHRALRQVLYVARAFCGFDAVALEILAETMAQ